MAQENLRAIEALRALTALADLSSLVEYVDLTCDISDQRRWWVRPINQERMDHGASEQLVREMRHHDDEEFFHFTRLSIAQFDQLLGLVGPTLLKKNTRSDVLSPYMRLLITLRFAYILNISAICYLHILISLDTLQRGNRLCPCT